MYFGTVTLVVLIAGVVLNSSGLIAELYGTIFSSFSLPIKMIIDWKMDLMDYSI